jgi:hypothetical protein
MSGGGVNEDQVLGTALTIGAAIAAPQLAPVIFGSGAGILGTAATGAVLGATANAVTNRDPLQGAVTGGIGGAASGYLSGADALPSAMGPTYGELGITGVEGGFAGPTYGQLGYTGLSQAQSIAPPPVTSPPVVTPTPVAPSFSAQAMDASRGMVEPPDTGYQQIGANPQANPNTTASPDVGAKNVSNVNTKVADTGIFGSGITSKQAMVGLGGLALWNAIQKENKKYGVPTAQNQVPANLNYALAQHTPMQLTRSYAGGGSVAMPNTNNSPIRQQIAANSIGNNQMFPQPGIHSNQFANSTNTPVAANMLAPTTNTEVDPYSGQHKMAAGGIAQSRLGGYAAGGNPHLLKGPGDGMSDNIPAMIGSKQPARLADGEFVIPADVVSHLGNGSTDAGAKKLHSMMDNVRKARTGKKAQGKQIKADKYIPKFADGGQVDPVAAAAQAAQAANQGFVAQAAPAIAPQGLGATAPAQTSNPQQNFINSLYQTNLGRAPENQVWNQQLANGATPQAVQQGIANSPEAQQYKAMQSITNPTMADQYAAYQNRYAQQYAPTNENFVRQAYMNTLGRPPEQAGADYWTSKIKSGELTPQQVSQAIASSQEAANVGNIKDAMKALNTPAMTPGEINNLIQSGYQSNLGRAADETGKASYFKLLQSGQMTAQQFIDSLKGSDEFKNKSAAAAATTTADSALADQARFNDMMRQYQAQNSGGG